MLADWSAKELCDIGAQGIVFKNDLEIAVVFAFKLFQAIGYFVPDSGM